MSMFLIVQVRQPAAFVKRIRAWKWARWLEIAMQVRRVDIGAGLILYSRIRPRRAPEFTA